MCYGFGEPEPLNFELSWLVQSGLPGWRLRTRSIKKNLVIKPTTSKLRTRLHRFKTGFWKRNADFKITIWNVTSLYTTNASQNLADVLTLKI